jgi:hypothetical protein
MSIFAGGNTVGASKASLNGCPKLAVSDDDGMSMILSGEGRDRIDIHPTAAASDRSRLNVTDDRKRMGPNYSRRCPRIPVILIPQCALLPPLEASHCAAALPMGHRETESTIGGSCTNSVGTSNGLSRSSLMVIATRFGARQRSSAYVQHSPARVSHHHPPRPNRRRTLHIRIRASSHYVYRSLPPV